MKKSSFKISGHRFYQRMSLSFFTDLDQLFGLKNSPPSSPSSIASPSSKATNVSKGGTILVPSWALSGNGIPISFDSVGHVDSPLVCPYCSSTNIVLDDSVLKTVPERSGVRIGMMCNVCKTSGKARNPALVVNVVTRDGKTFMEWEK